MRVGVRLVFVFTALVIALPGARPALAQGTPTFSLALTGGPLVFAAPTAADFAAGAALHPTGLGFQVDLTGNPPSSQSFQTTVSIRASSATLGGYGKPLGHLEWSLGSAAGPWTPLTTSNVAVESRTVQRNRVNDPWGSTLHFRMLLSWTTDVPASYATGIVLTLTLTGP